MRKVIFGMLAGVMLVPGVVCAEEKGPFAAALPNNEDLVVVQAPTLAAANAAAIAACKAVSKTCSGEPASTNVPGSVFVHVCCAAEQGCTIDTRRSRKEAEEETLYRMKLLGFWTCKIKAFYDAFTGKKSY
jgi:hypothetical protein